MLNIKIEPQADHQYTIVVESGTEATEYTTTHPVRTILNVLAEYNVKGRRGRVKGYNLPKDSAYAGTD